jgi:hypothetical protein
MDNNRGRTTVFCVDSDSFPCIHTFHNKISRLSIVPTINMYSFICYPHLSSPCGRGILFFACPKKRIRRVVCATPLKKGQPRR